TLVMRNERRYGPGALGPLCVGSSERDEVEPPGSRPRALGTYVGDRGTHARTIRSRIAASGCQNRLILLNARNQDGRRESEWIRYTHNALRHHRVVRRPDHPGGRCGATAVRTVATARATTARTAASGAAAGTTTAR